MARAKRARGADVNFMVLVCLRKSEEDRRKRVAFIFHVGGALPPRRREESEQQSAKHHTKLQSISAAINHVELHECSVRGGRYDVIIDEYDAKS